MRLLLFITLLTSYLFGVVSSPLHTQITELSGKELSVTAPEGAQIGMYGMIIHWFDEKHSVALTWVEVTKIEGNTATLKMIPIHALEQSALPSGTWVPKVGDEVILGYNYHRALLIAPSASIYKRITQYHTERNWVHPDIFATLLSANGHPTPLREDFSSACRANNIGIVSFMFDKSIISLDCQSFKILENKSTSISSSEYQLPFYSRVPHIEANWFGEGSDELEEYSPYYIGLIAENNPENAWIQSYKRQREQSLQENGTSLIDSWFDNIQMRLENDEESNGEE